MTVIDDAFRNPVVPLLTRDSIAWLDKHLNRSMVGVEYGGGSSTLWLLERLGELYTIEAQPAWAVKLIQEVSKNQEMLDKWRLYFVNCTWQIDDLGNRWYTRDSTTGEHQASIERSYCSFTQKADFVLVDGAIRYAALAKAVQMLKPSGVLCVDNMELPARERYANDLIPTTWPRFDFPEAEEFVPPTYFGHEKHLGKWITSIWMSPP